MQDTPEPANLMFLRRLVTTLTAVMIAGLVIIIILFVIRLPSQGTPLTFPDVITLPAGAVAVGYTQTPDWVAVVTDDDRVLVYDRADMELVQTITLTTP
ncbi:DUF6476 family protein [Thalassobium sp. R2A62]|uniref:DUF6476 family protein n=1 Tax=Thalassobium sp. R2A62 TaxID=633131 RepID=UPI0001B1D57D|nr:DUF6476 family protein [Thalassobium sp. R2A62]EET48569.1 hypothetical protein TR2A62_3684 [Thalassobium sp. R2A62]MDG1341174.1 DUF6476 family protein [Paracoccaceae bacterium]MDG1801441.1 DUF6476 family protein [Paracoccaceae bacterium]MDG2452886.1 DUF6476 family protein [Paracoccaceae bacterium]